MDAQEFSFPDAVRLWDTLFSDPAGRTDCLLRTCVAMLNNVRTELLQVPFPASAPMLRKQHTCYIQCHSFFTSSQG